MDNLHERQFEIRKQNIISELEGLIVTLQWDTEKVFSGSLKEQWDAKLGQIRSYIRDLRSLDPTGYIRDTLECLGRMSPTMHKAAVLKVMDTIRQELIDDQNYV